MKASGQNTSVGSSTSNIENILRALLVQVQHAGQSTYAATPGSGGSTWAPTSNTAYPNPQNATFQLISNFESSALSNAQQHLLPLMAPVNKNLPHALSVITHGHETSSSLQTHQIHAQQIQLARQIVSQLLSSQQQHQQQQSSTPLHPTATPAVSDSIQQLVSSLIAKQQAPQQQDYEQTQHLQADMIAAALSLAVSPYSSDGNRLHTAASVPSLPVSDNVAPSKLAVEHVQQMVYNIMSQLSNGKQDPVRNARAQVMRPLPHAALGQIQQQQHGVDWVASALGLARVDTADNSRCILAAGAVPAVPVFTEDKKDGGEVTTVKSRRIYRHESFPEKLYRILTETDLAGGAHVVSFTPDGNALLIHKPVEFADQIIPLYFRHKRLASFKRQLRMYGFHRITVGPNVGGFEHPLFRRGSPDLCKTMKRVSDIKRNECAAYGTDRR
jgi:hypothetical protein